MTVFRFRDESEIAALRWMPCEGAGYVRTDRGKDFIIRPEYGDGNAGGRTVRVIRLTFDVIARDGGKKMQRMCARQRRSSSQQKRKRETPHQTVSIKTLAHERRSIRVWTTGQTSQAAPGRGTIRPIR
ncbi:MAG: hypothetical protein AMXMBFR82_28880 [Candidatus Hydrogenedentota bacterium]